MSLQFNRRHFLAGASAALIAGVSAANARAYLVPGARGSEELPPPAAWAKLKRDLNGRVLFPGDEGYLPTAIPNNLRYAMTEPAGIAKCASADEVVLTLNWCRDNKCAFIPRAGGHSYAGFSTTRGLMVDLRLMNGGSYDSTKHEVAIQGGAINQDVYDVLKANKQAITHGRCPAVGAAAFLLGGGIGFNMRHNSIASDSMTSTEIGFADGSRRTVGPTGSQDDTELFWACRGGGGGNFGINTGFTMKTFDAPDITVFHVAWDDVSDAFGWNLMGALTGCPREFGSRISFQANNGKVKADLLGQFAGSRNFVDRLLRPFTTALAPSVNDIEQHDYWTGQKFLSEDQPPIFYQERSAYVSGVPDRRAFDIALKAVRNAPAVTGPVDVRFFQTGGAINDHASDETAFVHRKGDWLMVAGLYWWWDDEYNRALMAKAHAWQEGLYRELLPATLGGSYQNFTDPSLTKWQDAYYGPNYPRLQKVKKRVDPKDAFRFTQSIQPA